MSKPKADDKDENQITGQDGSQVADQDPESLKKDFDDLQSRFGELENQFKRAVADYHNLEKRVAEGRSELTSWATGELIQKILPGLDNLEKVVELGRPVLSERSESKEWFKGVEMSIKQLLGVLKDEGLEQIRADGQFDPALHEAVDIKEGEDNTILEVAEKGYLLNGKVLRPAKVVVGRKG